METYVNVVVTGDVGDVLIAKGVNAKIWFTGNMSAKARDLDNLNVDGPANGVYKATTFNAVTGVARLRPDRQCQSGWPYAIYGDKSSKRRYPDDPASLLQATSGQRSMRRTPISA